MTVIAGGSRCNGRYFGWHLQRTDRGQTVAVRDVVGLMGENMHDWFDQMEAMAAGGNTTNFFYHFSLSPREDEPFTDEQRKVAVATALKNLALEDQPYFLVEHGGKDGRSPHYHCIVLRVDLDTGKAISDSRNYDIHMRTADELEKLFGHEHTERGRGPDGPNPKGYEVQRGQETGIDPKDVKAELSALWEIADTGKAFAAALEERSYILAKGDRRDFVVIDKEGDDHSLARRLSGVKAAEICTRMADIDREALPSVDAARALARERAAERDASARDASPLPADPAARRDDKGVEPIAPEAVHAVTDPITEQKPPLAADIPEPSPTEASTPKPEPPTGFDHLAHEMIGAAEKAAPALLAAAEVTLAAEEHPQGAAKELSAFERIAQKLTQAMRREAEAATVPIPVDQGPPSQAQDPLDRYAEDTRRAMIANGGELPTSDGLRFWERAALALARAAERATDWVGRVKSTFQDFVGRFLHPETPDPDPGDKGIER